MDSIQVAKFVPGRTQSQCRDRYLNSLDPSLKWGGWTKEEDLRLEAAIVKHRFCWSKVAENVPPRTDSQCRKRWKVLFPDQVPLLQEARKTLKSYLASNFVDRESEHPPLTLNDFLPLCMLVSPSDDGAVNLPRKRKRKSRNFWRRHRRKVFVTVGVLGSGYFLYKLYVGHRRRLDALQREFAIQRENEELIKAQMQAHFENIQRISETITLPHAMHS